MSKKRIHSLCEDEIGKSLPPNHCLSSLSMPHDATRRSSGQIFYPSLTLILIIFQGAAVSLIFCFFNGEVSITPIKHLNKVLSME